MNLDNLLASSQNNSVFKSLHRLFAVHTCRGKFKTFIPTNNHFTQEIVEWKPLFTESVIYPPWNEVRLISVRFKSFKIDESLNKRIENTSKKLSYLRGCSPAQGRRAAGGAPRWSVVRRRSFLTHRSRTVSPVIQLFSSSCLFNRFSSHERVILPQFGFCDRSTGQLVPKSKCKKGTDSELQPFIYTTNILFPWL